MPSLWCSPQAVVHGIGASIVVTSAVSSNSTLTVTRKYLNLNKKVPNCVWTLFSFDYRAKGNVQEHNAQLTTHAASALSCKAEPPSAWTNLKTVMLTRRPVIATNEYNIKIRQHHILIGAIKLSMIKPTGVWYVLLCEHNVQHNCTKTATRSEKRIHSFKLSLHRISKMSYEFTPRENSYYSLAFYVWKTSTIYIKQ